MRRVARVVGRVWAGLETCPDLQCPGGPGCFSTFSRKKRERRERGERATAEIWQKSFPFQPGPPGPPFRPVCAGQAAAEATSQRKPTRATPGHPMIEQHDDSVIISGRPLLGAIYRAVLLGIAHRRANGVPSDDLQQLAKLLYRAYMSPQRHELATRSRHSGRLEGSGWRAHRQRRSGTTARREPTPGAEARSRSGADLATRCGPVWLYRRAAVLALAQQRKAAHHGRTTAARTDGLSPPVGA